MFLVRQTNATNCLLNATPSYKRIFAAVLYPMSSIFSTFSLSRKQKKPKNVVNEDNAEVKTLVDIQEVVAEVVADVVPDVVEEPMKEAIETIKETAIVPEAVAETIETTLPETVPAAIQEAVQDKKVAFEQEVLKVDDKIETVIEDTTEEVKQIVNVPDVVTPKKNRY
jgi:hypothetical protein